MTRDVPAAGGGGAAGVSPPLTIGCTPFETRAEVLRASAIRAEARGLGGFALAEASGHAAPVLLADIAVATQRIELSSSILSVWGRSAATLAMTAVSLQQVSRGRFVLGLGPSTQPLAEGLHEATWSDPVGRLESVLLAVRALLAGERLPTVPEGAHPLRLAVLPDVPVPLAVAALGPRAVRVAGAHADRWLPFLWPRHRIEDGRELLDEGRRHSGRAEPVEVHASVPLAAGVDEAAAAAAAARWLLTYCTRMGPLYPRMLRERFGYGAEIDALLAANSDPRRPVLPRAAERLARDVTLMATFDDVVRALAEWQDCSDRIGVILPFGAEPSELERLVDTLAPFAEGTADPRA